MNANRSMRSLRRAALGAIVLATAFPALADEPGSRTRLAAALARAGAHPLANAELDSLRGAGWFSDAFAAVINNVPQGYTATVQVDGTTIGEIGSSEPVTIPETTIGGTTFEASATKTGTTPTSITSTSSTTSTSTRTFSFSWSK